MKLIKRYFFPILVSLILLLPSVSLAACPTGSGPVCLNLQYPSFPSFGNLDLNDQQDLNQVVAWFYYFIVGIAGLAAFVMLVWGGFQYLSSAGNPAAIGDAKDKIKSALLGLLIILASFLILQVINPELTILKTPV